MIPIPYPLPATYKTVAVQPLILTPVTVREVERNLLLWARGRAAVMGGPMEQMESWGPPGSNKRRPCRVMVTTKLWEGGTHMSVRATPAPMLLGIPENYHATD